MVNNFVDTFLGIVRFSFSSPLSSSRSAVCVWNCASSIPFPACKVGGLSLCLHTMHGTAFLGLWNVLYTPPCLTAMSWSLKFSRLFATCRQFQLARLRGYTLFPSHFAAYNIFNEPLRSSHCWYLLGCTIHLADHSPGTGYHRSRRRCQTGSPVMCIGGDNWINVSP
jgi:hypothetical protein